jgi:DNA-binding transcriptional MerR regulator
MADSQAISRADSGTFALSIGDLSRRTGCNIQTIRYYEQIGLLAAPPRTEGGQRRFAPGAVQRLGFIRHARDLGFDIAAIRELIALAGEPDRPCADADRIARAVGLGEIGNRRIEAVAERAGADAAQLRPRHDLRLPRCRNARRSRAVQYGAHKASASLNAVRVGYLGSFHWIRFGMGQ